MTPESTQQLLAWQTEITGELEAATQALPALEAEREGAVAAACAAESAHRDLQTAFDASFGRLASPLAMRAVWLRSQVDEARGHAARATGAVETARAGVAELQRALRQIDHLLLTQSEKEAA